MSPLRTSGTTCKWEAICLILTPQSGFLMVMMYCLKLQSLRSLILVNQKYLSIISAWELAIKISLGKLDFNRKAAGFLHLAKTNGFIVLPIKDDHLTSLESLPLIHRDPFDRLLIATALIENMTLITADKNIAQYDVRYLW